MAVLIVGTARPAVSFDLVVPYGWARDAVMRHLAARPLRPAGVKTGFEWRPADGFIRVTLSGAGAHSSFSDLCAGVEQLVAELREALKAAEGSES